MITRHPDGVSIFVLVDAFGWEILRNRPFLDDVLTERRRLDTILGYSSGAIPTLLTGQYPSEHGHWNLFYRSPATSPFRWTRPLLWLPRQLREDRIVRRVVKEISHRVSGYSGYFAIYNLPLDRIRFYDICETADIYQPGGLAPARTIFDTFVQTGTQYECYTYHQYRDDQTLDRVPQRLRESDSRVYFLYLSELDAFLHFHVSEPHQVTARVRWYEEKLRRILDAATARWGTVRMYVFSDHGMTPIRGTEDFMPKVERLGLTIPNDYLPAYDSTMARFWVFSDRADAALRSFLGSQPFGRLLSSEEMKRLHIDFDDNRYGHLVFVMKPGTLICPSDMGRVPFDGMHGFHPDEDPCAAAALLSTEPLDESVRHIADVQSVILSDLALEPVR